MKVIVNMSTCQNMGQCVYEAPEVFSLDEQGRLQYVADVENSLLEQVEASAMLCPTQSISVEYDD